MKCSFMRWLRSDKREIVFMGFISFMHRSVKQAQCVCCIGGSPRVLTLVVRDIYIFQALFFCVGRRNWLFDTYGDGVCKLLDENRKFYRMGSTVYRTWVFSKDQLFF